MVEIVIDTLVLQGVANFDAERFGAALSGELARLLDQPGVVPRAVMVDVVGIESAGPVDATTLGTEVAQAIITRLQGDAW